MSSITFIDGDFTVPCPISEPVLSAPLPGVSTDYILKQEFVQFGKNAVSMGGKFSPLALNTIYGTDFTSPNSALFPDFFLTAESPLEDYGAGIVRWTRTYCKKPAQRFESTNLSYQFPGYNVAVAPAGGGADVVETLRLPTTANSNCKLQYDYFLIGSAGTGLATPDYADFISIPAITRQRWGYNATNGAFTVGFVDIEPPMLWDAGVNTFFPGGTIGTYPGGASVTASTYIGWQAAGTLFVAEDSMVSRWQGNIHQRVTKYIVAK